MHLHPALAWLGVGVALGFVALCLFAASLAWLACAKMERQLARVRMDQDVIPFRAAPRRGRRA